MDEKNNGGPAFPVTLFEGQTLGDGTANGMTLRDYFAAKALPAILGDETDGITARMPSSKFADGTPAAQRWAEWAYQLADAMLAERAK